MLLGFFEELETWLIEQKAILVPGLFLFWFFPLLCFADFVLGLVLSLLDFNWAVVDIFELGS